MTIPAYLTKEKGPAHATNAVLLLLLLNELRAAVVAATPTVGTGAPSTDGLTQDDAGIFYLRTDNTTLYMWDGSQWRWAALT